MTPDEELAIRAFQRQVVRLRNSSIVSEGKVRLSLTTNISLPSGEVTKSFEGYDRERFQAQLPILRQFILSDEISFNHIHNIMNRCCDRSELVSWIRYARRKWDERLASLPEKVNRHFPSAIISVDEALKRVFYGYGGLFHVDIHEPEEDLSIRAIEDEMLHGAFPYLFWCLNVFDSAIHWWLDEPGEEVPPLPEK